MGRYTIRRLLQMIPVVIGTTFIIYAMVWALPGDPFVGKCGDLRQVRVTAVRDDGVGLRLTRRTDREVVKGH